MFEISELKVPIVVMLSDGLPTAGVTNLKTIRENVKSQNTADVAVFSLGFGDDVDFEFLKALSLENYGIAIRIFEGEDASEQITNFYDTISTPLLKNLLFKYSQGAYEIYPVKVDRLFEGSEVVVVGKYDSPERSITSTVDATSWEGMRTFTETFKLEESTNYSFIPRFWAYAKITYLLDFIAVYGNNESVIENVTNMALEYGFVTPYTSFLVEITEKEKEPEPDDDLKIIVDDDDDTTPVPPSSSVDTDNDGLPDNWEVTHGFNPNDPSDANTDFDGDGYTNLDEYQTGTAPDDSPSMPLRLSKDKDDEDDKAFFGINDGSNLLIPIAITVIWIFIIISLFIYTRIKRNRLLEQKRREMIFNYIKENPGEHFRGIQKALGLEVGVVAHHINILEREDLVKSRQDGMYRRFYPMDTKIDIKLILTKIQERILNRVKTNPGVSQKTIATHLGINRKVVNYHIKILQDAGFVYTEKQGRESLCYSVDAA
jgi:DNA-binding MarR family transcriptional regulator